MTTSFLRSSSLYLLPCLVFLLLLAACSSSSSSSDSQGSGSVLALAPNQMGKVLVVGTLGATPGQGMVQVTNITRLNSADAGLRNESVECGQSVSDAHPDGSFYSVEVCAEIGDQLKIDHIATDGTSTEVKFIVVPASSATTCPLENERPFHIRNVSNSELWLGVTAGTMSCRTDADCPTGAPNSCAGADPALSQVGFCTCNQGPEQCGDIAQCNPNNKQCFFNLPEMGVAQMRLSAQTGQSLICFPAPPAGQQIQWSGNMFPRTGCDVGGQKCETGECNSAADKPCPPGTGGVPPATLFEFTITNQTDAAPTGTGPDYYDISIIGGINVGMEVGPKAGTYTAASDPYSCGTAGGRNQSGALTGCSWKVDPVVAGVNQSSILRYVQPTLFTAASCPGGGNPNSLGYCECDSDAQCEMGQFCGSSLNAAVGSTFASVCGRHIGWWTANVICGASINTSSPYGAPLNCASTVANSDGSNSSYTNFHLCTTPAGAPNDEQAQSCYSNIAGSDCCGCGTDPASPYFAAWDLPVTNQGPAGQNGCFSTNQSWISIAQPWLVFLKQACPTAYTYPYDDATSTFTCQRGAAPSAPAYEVTFFDTL